MVTSFLAPRRDGQTSELPSYIEPPLTDTNDAQAGRDVVQHLADRLADLMDCAAAAGTGLRFNVERHVLALEMIRQAESLLGSGLLQHFLGCDRRQRRLGSGNNRRWPAPIRDTRDEFRADVCGFCCRDTEDDLANERGNDEPMPCPLQFLCLSTAQPTQSGKKTMKIFSTPWMRVRSTMSPLAM